MKRFFRFLGICFGISLLLCSGVVLLGRTQPQPDFVPALRDCNATHCYLNIIIGKTTEQDAEVMIRAEPDMKLIPDSRRVSINTGLIRRMDVFPSAVGLVKEIDLYPGLTSMSIAEVVAHWGKPCAVISQDSQRIAVTYPGMAIFVASKDWRIQMTSTVSQINVFVPMMPCDLIAVGFTSRRWHGFERYPR